MTSFQPQHGWAQVNNDGNIVKMALCLSQGTTVTRMIEMNPLAYLNSQNGIAISVISKEEFEELVKLKEGKK